VRLPILSDLSDQLGQQQLNLHLSDLLLQSGQ
jgi:hypothetical protein